MADPTSASKSEGFGSVEDLMFEALDKASSELDKIVKTLTEQLSSSNEALEKSLKSQLWKVVEQSKIFVDSNAEDLIARREELIDRLSEFERSELETMVLATREVRHHVAGRAQQACESISRLVEEHVAELKSLIDSPEARFSGFSERENAALLASTRQGIATVETNQTALEQALSQKASELDARVQEVISSTREEIEKALSTYTSQMEDKITGVVDRLSEAVSKALDGLSASCSDGSQKLTAAVVQGKTRLSEHLDAHIGELRALSEGFQKDLDEDRQSIESRHTGILERKVDEVKDEINHIAEGATVKITASHKLFISSLKRLEKKYNDRLEKLVTRFEAAMQEESSMGTASIQSSNELRDMLHARLKVRGAEMLKGFRRQVELLESEYTRASVSSSERIEQLRSATGDSIEKEVRESKSSIDQITRKFHSDLADLHGKLSQIEEQGRAVALAVMTYKSAMNSFDLE